MFFYFLATHYHEAESGSVIITALILYSILFSNLPVEYRNFIVTLLAVIDGVYYYSEDSKPHKGSRRTRPQRTRGPRGPRRVHFDNNVQVKYFAKGDEPRKPREWAERVERRTPISSRQAERPKTDEFFPHYMTYNQRKPAELPKEIDNRVQYDDIASQDNSVLSSFADSFAASSEDSD